MKKKLLLTFLSVLSIISTIRGQEIGANFNESISEPLEQVNLLKKSGVTWVRGFIDLPLHLLENEGQEGKQKIVGVKEEVIKNYQPTWDFIQAKKILGDNVHFILSLKIPFERYEEGAFSETEAKGVLKWSGDVGAVNCEVSVQIVEELGDKVYITTLYLSE